MSPSGTRIRSVLISLALVSTAAVGMAAAPAGAEEIYFCHGRQATMWGTPGDDVINGTAERDVIVGLAGDDVIHGLGGNDVICGNNGLDTIYGDSGADRVYGGNQADTILGNSGSDFLYGESGRDVIYGGSGHDRLYGGGSNDELRAGRGNDRLFGHGGDDDLYGGRGADVCIGETESSCEMDFRGPRDEELWRDLVDEYFGDIGMTDDALVIVACESNGDPFAVHPLGDPKGLWQYRDWVWDWRAPLSGWDHETRFHPRAATATARDHYDWADGRTRESDGSVGQGFDPWQACRCYLDDYRDVKWCIDNGPWDEIAPANLSDR